MYIFTLTGLLTLINRLEVVTIASTSSIYKGLTSLRRTVVEVPSEPTSAGKVYIHTCHVTARHDMRTPRLELGLGLYIHISLYILYFLDCHNQEFPIEQCVTSLTREMHLKYIQVRLYKHALIKMHQYWQSVTEHS